VGQALARALPPGRLEDACHALTGLGTLTSGPLPRPVVLALPRPRLPASEAVLRPPPSSASPGGARPVGGLNDHKSACELLRAGLQAASCKCEPRRAA